MILENCRFVQFVMNRFRVKLVLSIGSDDDSHERDSCSSLLHQDIYDAYDCDWSPFGVQSCDLSIYDGVEMGMQCLRDDRPWMPSYVGSSDFHACRVDGPQFKYVCAVTSEDHITEFLIDSGSDATWRLQVMLIMAFHFQVKVV